MTAKGSKAGLFEVGARVHARARRPDRTAIPFQRIAAIPFLTLRCGFQELFQKLSKVF